MLTGVFRKLSLPFLLLSLLGYLLFIIGFGFRNASYKDNTDTNAAAPEYFFMWLYLCSGPILYVLSLIQSIWESKYPTFLVLLLAPLFIGAIGGVAFFNGIQIYGFYRIRSSIVNVGLLDLRAGGFEVDIHGEQRYVTLEFAGVLASFVFYVRRCRNDLTANGST